MSSMKEILVIDSSSEMHRLYESFVKGTEYEICGHTSDGYTGLSLIKQLQPDIVIMEIILPHMDGFELLERISQDVSIPRKPATMIISAAAREDIIQSAFRHGAGYYMIKPVTKEVFLRRLERVSNEQIQSHITETVVRADISLTSQGSLEEKVTELLRSIAVPPHVKGYQYLRDSIMIVSENKDCLNAITKVLYPAVAKMNNTSSKSVERAVRHAIEITFEREHTQLLDDLFSYSLGSVRKHPTSSEFIAVLADRVRLSSAAVCPANRLYN